MGSWCLVASSSSPFVQYNFYFEYITKMSGDFQPRFKDHLLGSEVKCVELYSNLVPRVSRG